MAEKKRVEKEAEDQLLLKNGLERLQKRLGQDHYKSENLLDTID